MSLLRTGVYVDDFSENSSSLAPDLERMLNTMKELDTRSNGLQVQIRDQVKSCLSYPSQPVKSEQVQIIKRLRKDIAKNQATNLQLCTEKVEIAQHALELIDIHIKRLDEDLASFEEELKQEGKTIPVDEPSPPLGGRMGMMMPTPGLPEKRRNQYSVGGAAYNPGKRLDGRSGGGGGAGDRDDGGGGFREPSSVQRKRSMPAHHDSDDVEDEPTYCICGGVSFGDMIECDSKSNCKGGEWFHYECVGLDSNTAIKGKWFCPTCRSLMQRKAALDFA